LVMVLAYMLAVAIDRSREAIASLALAAIVICVHRELRRRARLRSVLDDIDGVGPVRRRAMLRHFGSLKRIREATTDEIAAVKGLNRELAAEIRRHLDEMTALLDVEESADSADQPALPLASSAISANNAGARVNDIPAQD